MSLPVDIVTSKPVLTVPLSPSPEQKETVFSQPSLLERVIDIVKYIAYIAAALAGVLGIVLGLCNLLTLGVGIALLVVFIISMAILGLILKDSVAGALGRRLQGEVNKFTDENSRLKLIRIELSNEVNNLKLANGVLLCEISTFKEENALLRENINKLEDQTDRLTRQIDTLHQINSIINENSGDCKKILEKINELQTSLKEEVIIEIKDALSAIKVLISGEYVKELQQKVSQLREEIIKLQSTTETLEKTRKHLENVVRHLNTEVINMGEQNKALKSTEEDLEFRIQQMKEEELLLRAQILKLKDMVTNIEVAQNRLTDLIHGQADKKEGKGDDSSSSQDEKDKS